MKAIVAVYDDHDKAVAALKSMAKAEFPMERVSIIGHADVVDEHVTVRSNDSVKNAPLAVGAIIGPVLGLLTGVGVFAIPGLGFLYGAGALIGALAGLEIGIAGGGILTLLATVGIDDNYAVKYDEHIKSGKFLVIVKGEESEVRLAKEILHTEGNHFEMNVH